MRPTVDPAAGRSRRAAGADGAAFAGARRVCEALMLEGVLTKDTHGTVIRLAPALTIERAQLDLAVSALDRALARGERKEAVAA